MDTIDTTRTETVIEESDWSNLVSQTYGRPYQYQQQDGGKQRGTERFTVPYPEMEEDFKNDTVPEIVNCEEARGVSFAAWLARDPSQLIPDKEYAFEITTDELRRIREMSLSLWWDRNFYPDFQTVANDLHEKGLLDAGEYTLSLDW